MTAIERYPAEELGSEEDDGTMPDNVEALRQAVVGRGRVNAESMLSHRNRRRATGSMWGRRMR